MEPQFVTDDRCCWRLGLQRRDAEMLMHICPLGELIVCGRAVVKTSVMLALSSWQLVKHEDERSNPESTVALEAGMVRPAFLHPAQDIPWA
eukprot:349485-Amphidinium_carterae.1